MSEAEQVNPPKTAMQGTLMFRRSDIMSRLKKWEATFVRNMRSAEEQDNQEWRENQLYKVRVVKSLMNDVLDKCPIFENPAPVEETKRLPTPTGGFTEGMENG